VGRLYGAKTVRKREWPHFRPCRFSIAHPVCMHGKVLSGGTFWRAQPLSGETI
jgi:hypothetical protein